MRGGGGGGWKGWQTKQFVSLKKAAEFCNQFEPFLRISFLNFLLIFLQTFATGSRNGRNNTINKIELRLA